MNLAPSEFPQLTGAASLSKPGFDIVLAIAGTRQAAGRTVRMLRAESVRRRADAGRRARCGILNGDAAAAGSAARVSGCFLDLSDGANGLSETVNTLFTRGFQSMLNRGQIDVGASALPASPDDDNME